MAGDVGAEEECVNEAHRDAKGGHVELPVLLLRPNPEVGVGSPLQGERDVEGGREGDTVHLGDRVLVEQWGGYDKKKGGQGRGGREGWWWGW